MSPLVISLALFAAIIAGATLVGGLLFIAIGQTMRPRIEPIRAFGAAFGGAFIGAVAYTILLKLLDKTDQDLLNSAFFISAAVGAAASFITVFKSFDVESSKVPMLW